MGGPKDESAQKTDLERLAKRLRASSILGNFSDLFNGALRRTVVPPTKEVEFFVGVFIGFIASIIICWLLAFFIPLPVSMAMLFVMIPLCLVTGIASARVFNIGRRGLFTFQEVQDLERADYRYRQKRLAIDAMRPQLPAAQIEDAHQKALMRYLEDLDQSEPARKVLKSEALTRMLTPGDGPG